MGDFDEDGHLDVIVDVSPSLSIGQIALARGTGHRPPSDEDDPFKFDHIQQLTRPLNLIQVGDVDGDGHLDLVASDDNTPTTLRGDGAGHFTEVRSDPADIFYSSYGYARVVDVDQDGHPDVVYFILTRVLILWGHGDGTFRAPTLIERDGVKWAAVAQSAPGSRAWIVGTSPSTDDADSSEVLVAEQTEPRHFQIRTIATIPARGWVIPGDFARTGKLAIASASPMPDAIHVVPSILPLAVTRGFVDALPYTSATIADFNGDGALDLHLWESINPAQLYLATNAGPLVHAGRDSGYIPKSQYDLAAGDFDEDGRADLLYVFPSSGRVCVAFNDWTPTATTR